MPYINRKFYDTETAEKISSRDWGYSGDFGHFSETLYRSPGGRFFSYGKGGPASKYAEAAEGGGWNGGSSLRLLSEVDAYAWLESEEEDDAIEKYFSHLVEIG